MFGKNRKDGGAGAEETGNGSGAAVRDVQEKEVIKTVHIGSRAVKFRIQNARTGLVDGQREVLDETLIDSMAEQMAQAVKVSHSKYNPFPHEIIIRSAEVQPAQEEAGAQGGGVKEGGSADMLESCVPRFRLDDVALNEKVRGQIQTAIAAVRYKKKMTEEWGMSEHFAGNRAVILNFYGKPGTGKSMAAEAIAQELGKKVYRISYSQLESKYVGETPKNIRKAFECAAEGGAVLVFDEADSFLGKRLSSVTQSADYGVNITRSVLLMELEKFTGVVVFTTNLISSYDEAFKRRILLSVYFEMPDEQARKKIWALHLGGKIPLETGVTADALAARYTSISGADIKDMVFYAALRAVEQGGETLGFPAFDYAHETIRERYRNQDAEGDVKIVSSKTITQEEYEHEINGEVSND